MPGSRERPRLLDLSSRPSPGRRATSMHPADPPRARSGPSRLVDLGRCQTDERFNAHDRQAAGPRRAGRGAARCRMFPDVSHSNLGDVVHGGAILTFIDMALFAGGRHGRGGRDTGAVTLDLLDPVPLARPARRAARRRGGAAARDRAAGLPRGQVMQDGELVAAFSGTLRKVARSRDRGRRRATRRWSRPASCGPIRTSAAR